jgi:type II secretory pathway pseudopilin PulG
MLKKLKMANFRGDTIVEVMVVLVVLSMAIAICYSTANSSTLEIRQAEENAEAVNYAQSQVEALRTLASPYNSQDLFTLAANGDLSQFCISQTSPYTVEYGSSYNASNCTVGLYSIKIVYSNIASQQDTFLTTVTWSDVEGLGAALGTDQVTLAYRIHEP